MSPEDDRSVCSPCRGTGKVVSNLGGQPHEVQCPWCGGSGRFETGRDAQAAAPKAEDGEGASRAEDEEGARSEADSRDEQ